MSGPLLVEVIRGGRVESLHEVDAVLLDASGRIVEAWGDATRPVMPRSAIKPIQALPLVSTGAADAFLLIGDKALQPSLREKYRYVYDIGELWYKHTGLPAVFALFIVHKRWATSNPQQFAELSLSLMNSREEFFKDLNHLPLEEDIKGYLKGLDYRFREEHLKSLELMEKFFREYVMGKL